MKHTKHYLLATTARGVERIEETDVPAGVYIYNEPSEYMRACSDLKDENSVYFVGSAADIDLIDFEYGVN